jgi:von Willebrand factor type A domain
MSNRVPLLFMSLAVVGCGGGTEATDKRPGVETRDITICLDGDATVGVGQFVLSDVDGNTIPATITTVAQTIDGDPPSGGKWEGGESLSEENLESDLHVTLVLDASESIATSALFDDMKAAASDLLVQGDALWLDRLGVFTWGVVWFNDWVSIADDDWTFEDIETIPAPAAEADGFTRMYAGIDLAIDYANELKKGGVAKDPLDNHLMVVFTDGQDNSSGRDSPPVLEETGVTESKATYTNYETKATSKDDIVTALENASGWLQASMLALGDDVDSKVLEDFAEAGGGTVYAATKVENLFEDAAKSFETVQYVGWRLPLNPGEKHKWKIEFTVEGLPKTTTVELDMSREADTPVCPSR